MGKYWKKTMTPDYSKLFTKWQTDISNAPHDVWIMGRLIASNKARAVRWDIETNGFADAFGYPVEICQWISFTDFADIRSCVWNGKMKGELK